MKLKILLPIFASSALVIGTGTGMGVGFVLNDSSINLEKLVKKIPWKIEDLFSRPIKNFSSFQNIIADKFQEKYGNDTYDLDFYDGNVSKEDIKSNKAIKIDNTAKSILYFNFTVVASKNGVIKGIANVDNSDILNIVLNALKNNSNNVQRLFVMGGLNANDLTANDVFQKINENVSSQIKNNYDSIISALKIANKIIDIDNFTSDIFNVNVLTTNDNDLTLSENHKTITLGSKIIYKLKYLGIATNKKTYDLYFPVEATDSDVMKILVERGYKYPKDENQFYFEWQDQVKSDMTILDIKNLWSQYFTKLLFDEFNFTFADKTILKKGIFEFTIGKGYNFENDGNTYTNDALVSEMWGYGDKVPYGWIIFDKLRPEYSDLKSVLLPNLGQNTLCINMKLGDSNV